MSELRELATIMAAVIFGTVAIVALLVTGIMRGIARPVDQSSCHSFGQSSGYEVKFVDYNFMDWDCLAKTANGKWVSAYNLRGVNQ